MNLVEYPSVIDFPRSASEAIPEAVSKHELLESFNNGLLCWPDQVRYLLNFGYTNYVLELGHTLVSFQGGVEIDIPIGYPNLASIDDEEREDFLYFSFRAMSALTGENTLDLVFNYMKNNPDEGDFVPFVSPEILKEMPLEGWINFYLESRFSGNELSDEIANSIKRRQNWKNWQNPHRSVIGEAQVKTFVSNLIYELTNVNRYISWENNNMDY
jgi:hypothetical protein